jgi:ribosomal protein S2
MQNQKQAVRNAITSVSDYVIGSEAIASEYLTDAQKAECREILFNGFKNGTISYTTEFASKVQDDSYLKKYVSGLLNNWLRKDTGLNNGQKYVAKNPGSRTGSGDAQLRELRKLMKTVAGTENEHAVQQAIDARIEEIKPQVEINVDALPDSLKHLVK